MISKENHYQRMLTRLWILQQKQDWKWRVDFLVNLVAEHISYFIGQGFSEEEALLLMWNSCNRVREFFGERVSLELINFYIEWNYYLFFQTIWDYLNLKNQNTYRWAEIEPLFWQLVTSFFDVEKLPIKWFSSKILNIISWTIFKNRKRIKLKLWQISWSLRHDQDISSQKLLELISTSTLHA